MAGGRPTKYTDETNDLALNYIKNYADDGDAIPSIEGLAPAVGVSRETVREWGVSGKHPEFSVTLALLQAEQKRVLVNKGLTGDYNSNIVKLALANHGMSDKQEVMLGGQPGNPIEQKWTIEVVSAKPTDT